MTSLTLKQNILPQRLQGTRVHKAFDFAAFADWLLRPLREKYPYIILETMFNINFVRPLYSNVFSSDRRTFDAKISMLMKSIGLVAVTFLFSVNVWAQQKSAPRLIVRGDDMGFSHSGNVALIKSSLEGIQTSIEIIVPSPWFPEAVKMLEQYPKIDVGIHIALTSEWDNVKYRPVSSCPSLINPDGYF